MEIRLLLQNHKQVWHLLIAVPHTHVVCKLFILLQSGADHISLHETFPADHKPEEQAKSLTNKPVVVQLLPYSGKGFDISKHFGCYNSKTDNCTVGCGTKQKVVYASCPNDIPAIQTYLSVSKYVNCDPESCSITVPVGNFVQFNPHAALYSQKAFWALPFAHKASETTKFPQVWPSVVQQLLWTSGHKVTLKGSLVQTFMADSDLMALSNIMQNWKCHSKSLELCVLNLVSHTIEKLQLNSKIMVKMHAWLQALKYLGYKFPSIAPQNGLCSSLPTLHDSKSQKFVQDSKTLTKEISQIYFDTCYLFNNISFQKPISIAEPWTKFDDILLIVVLNTHHYHSIPYVETLYRPFFPQILYCGPGIPDFESPSMKNLEFDFYTFDKTKTGHQVGSFNYVCMLGAINMSYSVAGYLFTSDDLIFSVSEISTFDKNRTWFFPVWDSITDDVLDPVFGQWGFRKYKRQICSVLSKMKMHERDSSIFGKCYNQLKMLNNGPYRVNGALADLYYIPSILAPDFAALGSLFLAEDIFLEVAVPTIIQCTERLDNVVELVGEYRRAKRDFPWVKFTKEGFF